jgi:hypothetical protein
MGLLAGGAATGVFAYSAFRLDLFSSSQLALPRTFTLDPQALLSVKSQIQKHSADLESAFRKLVQDADYVLDLNPLSVVTKPMTPPSGDKHDYMSLAPYFWPNPNTPTGLPYVSRDGETNPEAKEIPDPDNLEKMISTVWTLSLACYFAGDEKYASHAATWLRTWFLDSSTHMNPNLNYAEGIRGLSDGEPWGIIETHNLYQVVDSLGLIKGSSSWSDADDDAMKSWFREYLSWLLTSQLGIEESKAANNHGSWFDVQTASIALYLGDVELATKILRDSRLNRIAAQVEPDGRQPQELARTRSWEYSLFNLRALFCLASLGENVQIDLWRFETSDKRSVRKALDYLTPFGLNQANWPYKEIGAWDTKGLVPLLRQAAVAYNSQEYLDDSRDMADPNAPSPREDLLYPWPNQLQT